MITDRASTEFLHEAALIQALKPLYTVSNGHKKKCSEHLAWPEAFRSPMGQPLLYFTVQIRRYLRQLALLHDSPCEIFIVRCTAC